MCQTHQMRWYHSHSRIRWQVRHSRLAVTFSRPIHVLTWFGMEAFSSTDVRYSDLTVRHSGHYSAFRTCVQRFRLFRCNVVEILRLGYVILHGGLRALAGAEAPWGNLRVSRLARSHCAAADLEHHASNCALDYTRRSKRWQNLRSSTHSQLTLKVVISDHDMIYRCVSTAVVRFRL